MSLFTQGSAAYETSSIPSCLILLGICSDYDVNPQACNRCEGTNF